ncbi:MAG: hypothetical protein AB1746_09675 [Candidatus Zixiibacteriota bacterium]
MSIETNEEQISDRPLMAMIKNEAPAHTYIIEQIENITHRNLICYIANLQHPASSMHPQDDNYIEIVLRSSDLSKYDNKIDFMLSSPGGTGEAAEKICKTLKAYASNLRVIVPKFAMSAATILTMGADSLAMGETAELGPIDPQMIVNNGQQMIPAHQVVNAYHRLLDDLNLTSPNSAKIAGLINQLNQIDPILVQSSIQARETAEKVSRELLKEGLLKGKNEELIENAVRPFLEHGEQFTHGRGIRIEKLIEWGFEVEKLDKYSMLWNLIWELFWRCEVHIHNNKFAKYITNRQHGVQLSVIREKM